jgi:FtsZ-interacting cell division protein ZipA
MIMNPAVLLIVGAVGLGLIIFLVWSNIREERAFKQQLNNDYHKTKDEEGDIDTEEIE